MFANKAVVRMCWTKGKVQLRVGIIKIIRLKKIYAIGYRDLHSITDVENCTAASVVFLLKYQDQQQFIEYFREQLLNPNSYLGVSPICNL